MEETPFADAPETLLTRQPRSRMESWQRKLLDLSLRNNLLNTRAKAQHQLDLAVPSVAELEDALAEGSSFRLATLPASDWEQAGEAGPSAESLQVGAARLFRKRQLLAPVPPAALERSLRAIYSAARREMEESGANTLYIACGFLRWIAGGNHGAEPKPLCAPLLLLPVRLTRASVREGFTLSGIGEDAQINSTLLELLKAEYSLYLPELETELPKDQAGLDVPRIFQLVREAIEPLPGWAVEERCMLGMFSFSKFLMWKDLAERADSLLQNPVVRQLAADSRGRFPEQVGFPVLQSLDSDVDAHKVYTPLAADSSQLAAILAAARGKSFVLEGPPGTGKSQTIANMIAHCLGHGKTVLFVAEKAVALDVVYKRLARIGLGDFCLELHSNKTLPTAVIRQFRAAVSSICQPHDPAEADEWDEGVDTLTDLRQELNALPREMHLPQPDGESLYDSICRLAAQPDLPHLPAPDPAAPGSGEDARARRKSLLRCAHELATHYGLIAGIPAEVAESLANANPDEEEALADALTDAATAADALESALLALSPLLPAPLPPAWRAALLATLEPGLPAGGAAALLPGRAESILSALQEAADLAVELRSLRADLSLPYPDTTITSPELTDWLRSARTSLSLIWPLSAIGLFRLRKKLQAQALTTRQPDILGDLQLLSALREVQQQLACAEEPLPAPLRAGTAAATAGLLPAARRAARLLAPLAEEDVPATAELLERVAVLLADSSAQQPLATARAAVERVAAAAARLEPLLGAPCRLESLCATGQGADWARTLLNCRQRWRELSLWSKKSAAARALGCAPWVDALLRGELPADQLEAAAAAALSRENLRAAVRTVPALREFAPLLHEEKIRDFAAEDQDLRAKTGRHIRRLLTARASRISEHPQESAILQRELTKKRLHLPLRRLLAATPGITPLLKPCFLMSPLSVAQYLSADTPPFDVVIFDEASQIPVWDAIGAIGRGRSVIIAGDSRQMPPTSFFSRSRTDEGEDPADPTAEPPLESILDECLACGIPSLRLTWHYRSRSESLIAFSNAHYYEGSMTTFPAPTLQDSALRLHPVGGLYESGSTRRVNPQEARAVVDHVLATLRSPGFRYTEATSIGIITFNDRQQKLISDMLDDARAADPALEPFFAEENPEALFVKNLENVQGDERGIIYFSTTYGRDAAGKLSLNFGPLNLTGGERRLNVAITRARYAMHVFTSLRPEDIDPARTRARGTADLRAFLEYAHSSGATSTATPARQDPLATRLSADLAAHGYRCRTALGASDYRVDLAIERPDSPDDILAGITLDGPAYHAAYTARDRDIARPEALHQLGWRMLHLWSLDWWRSPSACLSSLLAKLESLRALPPVQAPDLPSLTTPVAAPAPAEPTDTPSPAEAAPYTRYEPTPPLRRPYEQTDRELALLMLNIADAEAPLTRDLLLERMAQAAPLPPARGLRQSKEQAEIIDQRLNGILTRLIEHELLCEHTEPRPSTSDTAAPLLIITQPGGPTVRPRTAGPRNISQISTSELQAHARAALAQRHCLPCSDEHKKNTCERLNLRKTQQVLCTMDYVLRTMEN